MVITDPIALPPGPRTAEASGRFVIRLPTPTRRRMRLKRSLP